MQAQVESWPGYRMSHQADEVMMEKLRKLVVSAGVLSRVLVVVRRVFQRQQQLVQELEDGMEVETSSVKKKATLVELFLKKVEVMIRDPAVAKSHNLPYR